MHDLRFPSVVLATLAALTTAAFSQTLSLTTVRVASGLSMPVWCGSPPGDETRLFVVEQYSGAIKIIKNGTLLGTPFLTVTGIITSSEQGLLGLAFHPNYAANGYVYVNYTRSGDGATMVDRYRVLGNPLTSDAGDPASRFTILGPVAQPFSNHNGGNLVFGPDGFLYIGLGDGGSGGDPACYAQNRLSLLGKMLRIDVDGGTPYAIPPTNPFAGNTAYRGEIWSLGLRNPWRYCFDRLTGDLYIGDVGQNQVEEIDFQRGTSLGGENYGWKIMEGNNCFSTASCQSYAPTCNSASLTAPIHTYTHAQGCSVTGGCVYRGCAIPELRGTYFFGDYCTSAIWSLRYVNGAVTQFTTRTAELAPGGGLAINNISHFGEDARGEIYVVDLGGEIFKIVSRLQPAATDLGYGLPGSNGLQPRFDGCGLLKTGSFAEFRLRFGPPGTLALLSLSSGSNPMPLWGGTFVPALPVELSFPLLLDAAGSYDFLVPGGMGPASVFAQILVLDPGLQLQIGFSNAVRINVLP